MKKIVITTTNYNKVERLKKLLYNLDFEILSLNDIEEKIAEHVETANTCSEIAAEKALYYVSKLPKNTIVLTQDDTLFFEEINDEDNPGVHIKEPVIKKYGKFSDEKAIEYYTQLANKYGGIIPMSFHYGHAVAIAESNERNIIKVVAGESKLEARLVNKMNKEIVEGYFLSSIIQVNINGEWIHYNDLDERQLIDTDVDLYKSINKILKELGY